MSPSKEAVNRAGAPDALAGYNNELHVAERDVALLHSQQRVVGV
ncbi:MAG TPA: hypothetical protein P5148_16170 [Anaerolineae bacterium]|nr:hypothetical protein [Anaerolineae bacterium]